MKKVRNFALMATAILFGMTSCSNDDKELNGGNNAPSDMSVMLRLEGSVNPESRAIGTEAAANKAAELSTGQIVFVRSGIIRFVYEIVSTGSTDLDQGKVLVTDLTTGSGVQFLKVDGTHVYVLGNKTMTLAAGDNFADKLAATDLVKADLGGGDYKKVVLYGLGEIKKDANNPNAIGGTAEYYAAVEISPVSSRIEIKEIKETGGLYDYTLEGIFINNYYEKIKIGATEGVSADKINYGADKTKYTAANYGTVGSTWHDMISASVLGDASTTPTGGAVWGYNVFPAKNKTTPTAEDNVPHIILHFKNVTSKANSTLLHSDYYLTITSYNVDEFKAGHVYAIEKIEFDMDDNGNVIPEIGKFNCDVKVSILQWIPKDLIPNIN